MKQEGQSSEEWHRGRWPTRNGTEGDGQPQGRCERQLALFLITLADSKFDKIKKEGQGRNGRVEVKILYLFIFLVYFPPPLFFAFFGSWGRSVYLLD